MVDNQIRPSEVSDHTVLAAFLDVPREFFVAPDEVPFAYADRPLRMTDTAAQRTMIEPVVLARLIQALPRGPEVKAMVPACGSGYSTAILSRLVGTVVAVESDATLRTKAAETLNALGVESVSIIDGVPAEGYPPQGPYDAILLEGALEIEPRPLILQLSEQGALATIQRTDRISRATILRRNPASNLLMRVAHRSFPPQGVL
jgi:protein-L-isoaspartate(D-aspartate) O-methyltransferase